MEYRVLARKYRPATFADLIGQEVLVRTLSNAIKSGRLAHAFLLTGIRGVGKTTTARIIARALNCIGEDGQGGPTIAPCGVCANCRMIAEGRHVDVLEMDAASRTGVNDIREIIDTVHYAPTSARYKIYIIDEVHMLSTSAFNALLKTLEEPPPHVKFIFATTESRKIPVTILSRCQRFDLRRIELETLAAHLENVARQEGMQLAPEASRLLAQAAEGSVRDGLSLLDQAIARQEDAAQPIAEEAVRNMLGLADKAQVLDVLTLLLEGRAAEALSRFHALYEAGADALLLLQDMLEFTHFITRIKLAPAVAGDITYAEHERKTAAALAEKLSMPVLARLWQMLLKGVNEARLAPSARTAAEMALVRCAYAADLPTPAEVIAAHARTAAAGAPPPAAAGTPAEKKTIEPAVRMDPGLRRDDGAGTVVERKKIPDSFPQLIILLDEAREALLASQLKQFASPVNFAPGRLDVFMKIEVPRDFTGRVAQTLQALTGMPWAVALSRAPGGPTLQEQEDARKAGDIEAAAQQPLVAKVFEHFPGAEVVAVEEVA